MSRATTRGEASASHDAYRGAQHDLVVRGSGFLSIVAAAVVLALIPVYPPTAQVGSIGWALVVPLSISSLVLGAYGVALKHRPSITTVYVRSLMGILQIGFLEWLAGGGKAPYVQLLVLPMLGSGTSQSVRRCGLLALLATTTALSQLSYSSTDALGTVTEFSLVSIMAMMTSVVLATTRTHRARLKDASDYANVLAHLDPLTGLPNRRAFDEALARAIETSNRDGTSLSLVLCDLNSFKQVNDTFGHAVGDQILQSIAHALNEAVRRPDAAFRWAGDEFAIILRDSDEEGANLVAMRLCEAVGQHCNRPDGSGVTIGTGVADLKPGMSANELLERADTALLRQKAQRSELRGAA